MVQVGSSNTSLGHTGTTRDFLFNLPALRNRFVNTVTLTHFDTSTDQWMHDAWNEGNHLTAAVPPKAGLNTPQWSMLPGGRVAFDGATLSHGTVTFDGATTSSSGMVAFERARAAGSPSTGRVSRATRSTSQHRQFTTSHRLLRTARSDQKCPGPNLERTDHADRLSTNAGAPVMGAHVYRSRGRPHTIVPAGCGPRSPQHGKSSDAGRQQC